MGVVSHARRWWALVFLSLTQLMVALDATVINIALPRAQIDLHFSDANRQWLVTAYALAFGSLMLLGGRLSDLWGRRATLIVGLAGFALSSAAGGASHTYAQLVAARAAQGAFGALLAPAALAALTTTFTVATERAKAFAIYGAVGASGAAVGLLLGGALTEWASWRWCLYANVIVAIVAIIGVSIHIEHGRVAHHATLDVLGTLLGSAGLVGLVYGLGHAVTTSWTEHVTILSLVMGVILIGLFIWWQDHAKAPLMPLRILVNRTRGGSLVALYISTIGIFGISLFLAYFLQTDLGYSPMRTGVDFLPLVAAVTLSASVASARLLAKTGPKPLIPVGMVLAMMGMVLLTRLTLHSTYLGGVLPGLILIGLGMGLIFAPAVASATAGIDSADAGAASALTNVVQQVGGSVGTALLNTIAVSVATRYVTAHQPATTLVVERASIHGYGVAFWWGAAIFGFGAIVTYFVLEAGVPEFEGDVVPLI